MIKSPVKWAGGKARVMPQLLKHLPKAECLIEPFVGSGTVFMNTDYRRYILCDSNGALINFFIVLRDDTTRLITIARNLFNRGNNEEDYYKERDSFNSFNYEHPEQGSDGALLYAAQFLYLNRHCYNGVYRANKDGGFNVPFGRYKAPYFPEAEMRLFAEKARDTHARFLLNDFRSSISFATRNRPDSVIYCDPPYIPTSKTANFTAYGKPFTLDDHRALVAELMEANAWHGSRVVISNSDTPETREIYSAFNLHSFSIRRSVSAKSRDMAGEVIGVLPVCKGFDNGEPF